jgi:hypothetical protein
MHGGMAGADIGEDRFPTIARRGKPLVQGAEGAVFQLNRYVYSHEEADFRRYLAAIAVPLGDRKARLELEKPLPEFAVAHRGFLEGRYRPAGSRSLRQELETRPECVPQHDVDIQYEKTHCCVRNILLHNSCSPSAQFCVYWFIY